MTIATKTMIAGRYVIQEKIGESELGDVYSAIDERLGRKVAVKQLKLEANLEADRQQYIERFEQDAKLISGLNHPNIVSVFDIHSNQDQVYMVMEYVNGYNLQEIIKYVQLPLPIETVLFIVTQLCEAIMQAHEHHIAYLNIEPANVLLSHDNHVKLTGLGIARLNENQNPSDSLAADFSVAPPEQVINTFQIHACANIYSIGAIAYALLTGQPFYDADKVRPLKPAALRSELDSPHTLNPDVSVAFSNIIMCCLSKPFNQRYLDMQSILADLYILSAETQTKVRPGMGKPQESTCALCDKQTRQVCLSLRNSSLSSN